MVPDSDGDWLSGGLSWDLMQGSTVRVMVDPQATKEQVLRQLRKMRKWVKNGCLDDIRRDAQHDEANTAEPPICSGATVAVDLLAAAAEGFREALNDLSKEDIPF